MVVEDADDPVARVPQRARQVGVVVEQPGRVPGRQQHRAAAAPQEGGEGVGVGQDAGQRVLGRDVPELGVAVRDAVADAGLDGGHDLVEGRGTPVLQAEGVVGVSFEQLVRVRQ